MCRMRQKCLLYNTRSIRCNLDGANIDGLKKVSETMNDDFRATAILGQSLEGYKFGVPLHSFTFASLFI